MKCGCQTLIGHQGNKVVLARLRCRSWHCPTCAPRNRRKLIGKILGGQPDRMLTLTSRPGGERTPEDGFAELLQSWRQMRKALRKRYGYRQVPFLAIWERHKSGWPHLHIILRGVYIPQRWASSFMDRRNSAPVVDIRLIHGGKQAAAYVAKYVTKETFAPKHSKRYWSNCHYPMERPPKPWTGFQWAFTHQPLGLLALLHGAYAGHVLEHSPDHVMFTAQERAPPCAGAQSGCA